MLDIQTVGSEILGNTPRKFYVFTGSEYGVKCKYLAALTKYYGECKCVPSVFEILKFMNGHHLIPVTPKLYVVRYDEEFLKSLDNNVANNIESSNISGTIVCIYEDSRSISKLDKYIPNYTVDISGIESRFMVKYIHADFPNLPDRLVELCVKFSKNYYQAQNIARCMSYCNVNELFELSDSELSYIFGVDNVQTDNAARISIASRNFQRICSLIESYPNIDQLMYTILNTLVELEKIHYNKYCSSILREYSGLWTLEDIYNMFMQTYQKLQDSRLVSIDLEDNVVYLAALMQFKHIPSLEEIA